MKIRVVGKFKGQHTELEWEDGVVTGSSRDAVETVQRIGHANVAFEVIPTPEDGFIKLDDWMSHPRGFVMCAMEALDEASTDWDDHEMEGIVLMR